jgi:glutamate-ammonia-ligase adenylyltransferase
LFDHSEFLAEAAIRTPDLVDALVLSGRLQRSKDAVEILKDLRHGRDDADQRLWLRRYHQAELMRIGLRDILGLAGFEQNLTELSALADACLQYALEVVLRKNKWKAPPLVIIGLGKLGGAEINYGSDLDIIFVTDAPPRNLPKLQSVAVEVMDLISSRTQMGVAFATDARLRPDGEKGLLVNTLEAYGNYYRHRAQLWEIQALSRTRTVAGNLALGNQFQKLAGVLTNFTPENVRANFKQHGVGLHAGLSAYSPQWKREIHRMRARIEKERTPPGQDALAIKTGAGGLMDAEFLAQTFCLAHGWQEANTLRALERARDAGSLKLHDADQLIEAYRRLRRVEGILRRWSFEGETVLPDEEAPFYRVSIRCGFGSAKEFRAALAKWRRDIRAVYNKAGWE